MSPETMLEVTTRGPTASVELLGTILFKTQIKHIGKNVDAWLKK